MDFDSIISFLLILLFFIFPTLLKRFSQKKKTISPQGKIETERSKKRSVFERLGDQLREYAQTLEKEAQEAREGTQSPENIWEQAEEEPLPPHHKDFFEKDSEPPVYDSAPTAVPSVTAAPVMPGEKLKKPVPTKKKDASCSPRAGSFQSPRRACQLQQAIVWSEILSRPVALR